MGKGGVLLGIKHLLHFHTQRSNEVGITMVNLALHIVKLFPFFRFMYWLYANHSGSSLLVVKSKVCSPQERLLVGVLD